MHDDIIPLFSSRPQRKRGWSNQDLGELYRIKVALVKSGISIDTETGETEEGDPWFVLCSAETGDVLVHVAVIDRQYCMASNWTSAIYGHSLTDVVQRFVTRHPALMLGINRGDNVLVHPSSIMIAVLSAVCLVSDEYNREIFGLSARDKAPRNAIRKSDPEVFNVADSRQLSLGDYTFSPQQAFIILSAIAFSASPIIQNNTLGLPTIVDIITSDDGDPFEVEEDHGVVFADTTDEVTSTPTTLNQVRSVHSDEPATYEIELAEIEGVNSVRVDVTVFETIEPLKFLHLSPEIAYDEPRAQEVTDEDAQLVSVDGPQELDASVILPVPAVVREPVQIDDVLGLVDRTFQFLGFELVETTDRGVAFASVEADADAVSGLTAFVSFSSLAELAPYFKAFEKKYGEAEVIVRDNLWWITNDATNEKISNGSNMMVSEHPLNDDIDVLVVLETSYGYAMIA